MNSNPKNITCPHCQSKLKIGINCFHDEENLSLKCKKCKKVVLPTLSNQDDEMPKSTSVNKRSFVYD